MSVFLLTPVLVSRIWAFPPVANSRLTQLHYGNRTLAHCDAGAAGEWESSGILGVSALFGEKGGTLFLADVQVHGIEDQVQFSPESRIDDFDLREGGQLLFLSKGQVRDDDTAEDDD